MKFLSRREILRRSGRCCISRIQKFFRDSWADLSELAGRAIDEARLLRYIFRMQAQETISVGQLQIHYLRDGSKKKEMGAFELIIPPGSNVPPPHSHTENEEIVYVLEGKLRYSVGEVTRDLAAGESMSTPKGSVHGFSNPFPDPVRALIVLSPDVGAQYFRDIAEVVNGGGPPDKAKLLQVMTKYGLQPSLPAAK